MDQIKVFKNEGLYLNGMQFIIPYYIQSKDAKNHIAAWKQSVLAEAKNRNADHFVYCVINYTKDDQIRDIHLYAQALNDSDFYDRTDAVYKADPNAYIGAWHRGTTY